MAVAPEQISPDKIRKEAALERELGTGFDEYQPLFESFDGGKVFDYPETEVREYNDMLDRDGKAATIEQVLTLPLRAAPMTIKPRPGDTGEAELVRGLLTKPANAGGMSTPIELVIGQMTGALTHRKSYFEKVFALDEGQISYAKVAWRPPSTCRLMRDKKTGAFRGFEQDHPNKIQPVWIKPHRALVYIHATHRDPLRGISDLRVAYWCYKTKQKLRFLWYQFLESQAMPKTLVRGDDLGQAVEQAKRVATLKSAGVLGVEKRFDIDTLESNGRGAAYFIEALRWLDQEASGSVLAGFTDLTGAAAEGRGSFALSKDQTDFYLQSRNAVLREMAACVESYLVADLVKYNRGPGGVVPEVQLGPIGNADMEQVQALLQSLAVATTLRAPDEFVSELVTKTAGFLDMDEDKIRKAIEVKEAQLQEQAQTEQEARVASMKAGVDVAAAQVMKASQPPASAAARPAAKKTAKKATAANARPSRPSKTQTVTRTGPRRAGTN